jgi:hypothetical protein
MLIFKAKSMFGASRKAADETTIKTFFKSFGAKKINELAATSY